MHKRNKITNNKNKLFGKNLELGVVLLAVIGIALLSATYLNLTGFSVQSDNLVEKTVQIEVRANTYLELETQQDSVLAKVFLDNGTLIEGQELEFYLDTQKSQSQNVSLFNLSEASPGIHSLKVLVQGSPTQYVNSASVEKEIEVVEVGGLKEVKILDELSKEIIETIPFLTINSTENGTEINKTRITNSALNELPPIIVPQGIMCQEFSEHVLWSSGYSNNQSSTNYQTWYPQNNCTSAGIPNCFLGNLVLQTRFLYFGESNQNGEGYIQISNYGNCNSPQEGIYERYLAYETINGEGKKFNQYCGNNKNSDSKCGIEFEKSYPFQNCYGIKSHADQYFLVDGLEIKYNLCGGKNGN